MMSEKKANTGGNKRFSYLSRLSRSLDKVTNPAFKNRGFAEHRIITDWPYIVGESIARYSNPTKLVFSASSKQNGTLHIEVYDSSFSTEIHYLGPLMKERIASYFGYRAVENFRLIQKPLPFEHEEEGDKIISLTSDEAHDLQDLIGGIEDESMCNALKKLGKERLLRQRKEKES